MIQETSLDAFLNIREKIGPMQRQVYDVIRTLGCPTDLEIVQFLGLADPNKVRPRRNDLLRMGMIQQHERRLCSVSGRLAFSWRVCDVLRS
jgi:hypothetical protein